MKSRPSDVLKLDSWTPSAGAERESGIVGFARINVHGDWRIDVCVRRSRAGRVLVVFPSRRAKSGRPHMTAGPIDRTTKRRVEIWLLRELGFTAEDPKDPGGEP